MPNFIDSFTEHVPEEGKILDVGAGDGRWSRHFRALGHEVVAIDRRSRPDDLALEIDWLEASLSREFPDFPSGHFDAVFARNVLQFLEAERVLEEIVPEMLRILKPSGIIAIETFFAEPEPTFEHLRSFHSADEMIKALPGLEILRQKQFHVTGESRRGGTHRFAVTQVIARKNAS